MRYLSLLFVLLLPLSCSQASEIPETKRQAIDSFLAALKVDLQGSSLNSKTVDRVIAELEQSDLNLDAATIARIREASTGIITDEYNLEAYIEADLYAMIDGYFTIAEIEALADFLGSPAWQKFASFERGFQAEFKNLVQQHSLKLRDLLRDRIRLILEENREAG